MDPSPPSDTSSVYSPGWPPLVDAPIRPGVRITPWGPAGEILGLGGCTANFIFASPDNRTLYIGTAGHCAKNMANGTATPVAEGAAMVTLAYCSFVASGEP